MYPHEFWNENWKAMNDIDWMKLFGSPDSSAYWCSMWFDCFIPSLWRVSDWMKDSCMLSTLDSWHKSYYIFEMLSCIFQFSRCTQMIILRTRRKKQLDWISHHNDEFNMRYTLEKVTSIPWILDTLWNRIGLIFLVYQSLQWTNINI